jgi:hypothetical protein
MTTAPLNCQRCGSATEAGDLRCPVCYLAIPHAAGDTERGTRVHIFRCLSCGPAMEYRTTVQAPQCAFCGSVLKLEEQIDPIEQTEEYLPFTLDRRAATETYRGWLSRQGFFQPANLASAARLESLRALWWTGWIVSADAIVTWTLDSNAGARRAAWAPHAGELRTGFDHIVIPATRGLSPHECSRLIPTYTVAGAVNDPQGDVTDEVRERFDVSRSVARDRIVEAIRGLAEARIKGHEAPGTRFRNFHAAIHLRGLRTRRVAFPAYAIAYRYRNRLYRTVISGQDPACVIGHTPISLIKPGLLVALILAGFAAVTIGLILRLM